MRPQVFKTGQYFDEVSGEGVRDMLSAAVGKVLGNVSGIRNGLQSGLNLIGRADPLSRPLFPGEHHLVEGPGSRFPGSLHNFSGPGTHLRERLARGDKPVNDVDAVSEGHDMAYQFARTPQQVREADQVAIAGWQRTHDDPVVARAAITAFRAKMKAEDLGLLDPLKFSKGGDKDSPLAVGGRFAGMPGQNLLDLAEKIHKQQHRRKR